jgi:hypothetical protein
MNNMVIVDHCGLFIYMNVGYPSSFHDVTIMFESNVYKNWRQFFVHTDEYFEYILKDPGYLDEKMFVMFQLGKPKLVHGHDQNVINVYNKMHVGYRVKVEWGIGGLKWKWRQLMKHFNSTKSKHYHLFHVGAILKHFLHKYQMDFTYESIGGQIEDPVDYG